MVVGARVIAPWPSVGDTERLAGQAVPAKDDRTPTDHIANFSAHVEMHTVTYAGSGYG